MSPRPTFYVSDLDGTLAAPDATLSAFSRRELSRMLGCGLPFTVASARSVLSMRGILGDLPLSLPVVCFNGGFVSELHSGLHQQVFSIPTKLATAVWELVRSRGLVPIVSTTDGVREDRVYIAQAANEGVHLYADERKRAGDPRLRLGGAVDRGLDERVTCLTLIDRRAVLEPLAQAIEAEWGDALAPHLFDDIYMVDWTWLTVHAGEASKDRAVLSVMKKYGMQDHRLVAFGDQENDLPLLRAADHAVVVANAAPSVLAMADEVIGANSEDAVVRWLMADFDSSGVVNTG